jgi:hypothetical protein
LDFFCILAFFKKNGEMNRVETYFQDLVPLSHARQVGVTHEGVMPVHMARLMGQARGLVPMWRHVGLNRAMLGGMSHEGVAPTTMA